MKRLTPRLRRLAAAVALGWPRWPPPRPVASADPTSDYNIGLALGTQAYQYGVPLLDTERIFKSSTSVTVCDHMTGHGPVNRFCSIRNLATAEPAHRERAEQRHALLARVARPEQATDRCCTPRAIRHRFWEFELVDPWTNNFFNITSAHLKMGAGDFNVTGGGNWAIVGPGFKGRLPRGVIRVNSPL